MVNRAIHLGTSWGGSGPAATFDPAVLTQITLSNGNLTATNSVGAGNFGMVRGSVSHSTGKYYLEWRIDATDGSRVGIGICNGTQAFSGVVLLGNGVNNTGVDSTNGDTLFNGGSLGLAWSGAVVNGDVVSQAINIGAKLGWWRKNAGNWNNNGSADPATGIGGYDISGVTGDLYFCADVESSGTIGTLRTTTGAYTQSIPSLFGNW